MWSWTFCHFSLQRSSWQHSFEKTGAVCEWAYGAVLFVCQTTSAAWGSYCKLIVLDKCWKVELKSNLGNIYQYVLRY